MTLKLNISEFIAISDLFREYVQVQYDGPNEYVKLLLSVLQRVGQRIHNQSFGTKTKYAIRLEPFEAIAFYIFFRRQQLRPELVFEQNLIRSLISRIHQNYIV